ncbi:hypothetical protein [Exiguobacterium sp. s63]|uniref:hypothetical protein n=1 Tax=Exiguobacterium sp. s63 TaxID=2751274 RepID=UPI001BE86EB7|nr:hypothetical protein [Exiguobacterium sp. s63]
MSRPQIIKEALEKKYGVSKFEVMHGMFSTLPIIEMKNDEKEVSYIVPQAKTIQHANKNFKLTFSVGVTGELLKSADDIKFSLSTSNAKDPTLRRIFASSIPEENISKIGRGFEMMAEIADLNFEENTKLTLRVEAIFNDEELINMVNEKLNKNEKPIEKSLIFSTIAARMLVIVEED